MAEIGVFIVGFFLGCLAGAFVMALAAAAPGEIMDKEETDNDS